jgi:adenosine/AMP kinase
MFAYCINNPVRCVDVTGCAPEEVGQEYRVVGAGVQLEVDYGLLTAGVEVIIYWDVEESRDNLVVAVYTYGGYSVNLLDSQLGSIVATIANSQELIMANPEQAMTEIVSVLNGSYSASVSGVVIFGNDKFNSIKSYEGSFTAVSGGLSHVKAGVAFSESCVAMTIGGTTSKSASLGISRTNYTLRTSLHLLGGSQQTRQ